MFSIPQYAGDSMRGLRIVNTLAVLPRKTSTFHTCREGSAKQRIWSPTNHVSKRPATHLAGRAVICARNVRQRQPFPHCVDATGDNDDDQAPCVDLRREPFVRPLLRHVSASGQLAGRAGVQGAAPDTPKVNNLLNDEPRNPTGDCRFAAHAVPAWSISL